MFGDIFDPENASTKLTDVLVFNPSKSEIKGKLDLMVSYVPMEKVGTDGSFDGSDGRLARDIYKGLTYFKDGDVLMAKISPCFENGKITTAANCINGIGFGTTEFFVFRPVPRKTTQGFIHGLIKSNHVDHECRLSLNGTVGQQRINSSIFTEMKIHLPPYELQKAYDAFLKEIDKLKFGYAKKGRGIRYYA